MERSITLKGQTFQFRSIKEILAKANELKSGDVLAGIAAGSDLERIAAKAALSDIPLSELYENPVVPYETDEVTRLDREYLDPEIYQSIRSKTVGEFREWLLSYEADEDAIRRISKGITAEMAAAVCK